MKIYSTSFLELSAYILYLPNQNIYYKEQIVCFNIISSGVLYSRLQRVTIPDAVIIQFVVLKMRMLMFETCRGL
jgi:hypothetical protein